MSRQAGDSRPSASQLSRERLRVLIAAIREAGAWFVRRDGSFPDSATVNAMIEPVLQDPARLDAVHATGLVGKSSPELDRMAMLAALALGTPYAAVSLISDDCQTIAGSHVGGAPMPPTMPLEQSLCRFAVASGEPFFVENTRRDPLSAGNPLVQAGAMASYAGVPLVDANDYAVGALACWDVQPRLWTTGHIQILSQLASVVEAKIFTL